MECKTGAGPVRLLVLIVAFHAEAAIAGVLSRLPRALPGVAIEALVLDDASTDATFERACAARVPFPLTVLRNPANQGYGGNQKIGYHYALAHGFDAVALVHGDGQYAPEELGRLVQPLLHGEAEVVLGSRMIEPGAARRGGMPFYKRVGNRVLSGLQNRLCRAGLSEFHCGYRVYSVSALRRVAFARNSDGFDFDTEIILQMISARQRIVELPIPTHYGDEICRVNGMAYAARVTAATLRWRMQALGLLHDPKYGLAGGVEDAGRYECKLGFASTHRWARDAVPSGATVLDVGCSDGHVAAALAGSGCRVIGTDRTAPAEPLRLARFLLADLDEGLADPGERVDYVLALDVIEHLRRPERLAAEIHRLSARNRELRLVISTGNVAFLPVRLMLLLGWFSYGRRGILDATHTRLFTFGSLRRLLRDEAFTVERVVGLPAPFPLVLGDTRLARTLLRLNAALIRMSRTLFSYQMLMVARPIPTPEWLLGDALDAAIAVATAVGRGKDVAIAAE